MTTYVILQAEESENGERPAYTFVGNIAAANTAMACRAIADSMSDTVLDEGVTLIAVPQRNWTSGRHTLKAETQRRIRPA